jgi:CopG family nickel-responsive transcriptional regulator
MIPEMLREYSDVVASTTITRPSPGYVLYIVLVHGNGERVKELYKLFAKTRGVLSLQASLLPIPTVSGK